MNTKLAFLNHTLGKVRAAIYDDFSKCTTSDKKYEIFFGATIGKIRRIGSELQFCVSSEIIVNSAL